MSLIGIDLGTSSIKVVAYATDGTPLAQAAGSVPAYRPEPGHWEVDVLESRAAFRQALGAVAADPRVRHDPPVAISFSSSGREVFPVAADGTPLGRCLMTPDVRGDEVAAETAARRSPEEWFRLTGHVPRRMDPVNRALWWRRTPSRRRRQDALVHELARVLRPAPRRAAGRRLERRRHLGDLRRRHRRLVAGADRRDRDRSGVAAGDPAQRGTDRADPARRRRRARAARRRADRDRRLRHVRRVRRVGGRGARPRLAGVRHLAQLQHAGPAGLARGAGPRRA